MARLNNGIEKLKRREIAGPKTINPLIDFCLNAHSLSQFLWMNPDGRGSYSLDLDIQGLSSVIGGTIIANGGAIDFDFKATISEGTLYVTGGRVLLPFHQCEIAPLAQAITAADSGKMLYIRLTSPSSGTIVLGSGITHTCQTGDGYRLTLPLAIITLTADGWHIGYMHVGSYALAWEPYFWITGYSKGERQHLMHDAGSDGTKWEAWSDESSSSSGSGSSSSSSSSSGSGSSSSSSSSSSGGPDGVLIVTTNAPTPRGCEGTYSLVSGSAHDETGIWKRDAETSIYCQQGGWILAFSDGYMINMYAINTNSATPTDPTTWTEAAALLSPAMGYVAYIKWQAN